MLPFDLEDVLQGHPWNAKVLHVADFKSAYSLLIIAPRGLECENKWAGNLLMWSDLTLGPPLRSNEDSQT